MDTKQLEMVRLVVEHKGFTKAAHCLKVTQSVVSYQISALEKELGFAIFQRLPQSVRLTPQGRHFYFSVEDVLVLLRKVVEESRAIESGALGQVTLGIAGHAGGRYIPRLLAAFRERHPGIMLQLSRLDLTSLDKALEEHQIDIGVTLACTVTEQAGLCRRHVSDEPVVVLLPEGHPLGGRAALTLEELRGQPLVHLVREGEDPARSATVRIFSRYGHVPNIVQQATDFDALFMFVEAGVGLTVLPAYRATTCGDARLKIVPLAGDGCTEEVVLVWKRDTQNPALSVLLAETEAILGEGQVSAGQETAAPQEGL